jgi:anaerobic selenocysteine-containing dehydrogenase
MAEVQLGLHGLDLKNGSLEDVRDYSPAVVRGSFWDWDRVVKASHLINCWYQQACSFNVYVKDGLVLREEQVGNYPPQNDPSVPDFNPRGCQKGTCYVHRIYDPTRIKYPLKRAGERGEGKWKRISWEEALTEIADVIIDTVVQEGPDAIVQGGGTRVQNIGSEGMAVNGFFEGLGCPLPTVNAESGGGVQRCCFVSGSGGGLGWGEAWAGDHVPCLGELSV